MSQVRITTIDNPFDPQEDFKQWFTYDVTNGYNTCAYLSRIAKPSDQLSDEENERENERAIDEIIKYDFQNIYIKVKTNTPGGGSSKTTPPI